MGRWPWNRSVFGEVITKIDNARVIGFDVGFFEETIDDIHLQKAITDSGNIVLPIQLRLPCYSH